MRLAGLICIIWTALTFGVFAAPNEDVRCVQAFLSTTSFDPGPVDGALGKKTVGAATEFAARAGFADRMPVLSEETAAAWCAFASGPDVRDVAIVASLKLYPIEIGELAEIDAGIGPIRFDFSRVKLASRYDGMTCNYIINRNYAGNVQQIAEGSFSFSEGRVAFLDSKWLTGGLAKPETFQRANLAITEKGELVGKMPVFFRFVDPGAVPMDGLVVTLGPKSGKLGQTQPTGSVTFDLEDMRGELVVRRCSDENGGNIKYAFDFSQQKLTRDFDGYVCRLLINRILLDEGNKIQPIGAGSFTVSKGLISFNYGSWRTGGDAASFAQANLGITTKLDIVGVWDVYGTFPDAERPTPPVYYVKMKTIEGKLDDKLRGSITFPITSYLSGQFIVQSCRKPA